MTRRLAVLVAVVVLLPALAFAGAAPPGAQAAAAYPASDQDQVRAAPAQLRGFFLATGARYRLQPALLAAIAQVESGFDPAAVGPVVPGGPALGMMQFLPSSWLLFNTEPGASPFDPAAAVDAAARHLLASGAMPGGGWDVARALFGYNHSLTYVRTVLAQAAAYGYRQGRP